MTTDTRFGPNTAPIEALLAKWNNVTPVDGYRIRHQWASVAWNPHHYGAWKTIRVAQGKPLVIARSAISDAVDALRAIPLIGQHGIEQDHIDTLLAPVVEVFGPVDTWNTP